jgi:serine/threonine protein kinase
VQVIWRDAKLENILMRSTDPVLFLYNQSAGLYRFSDPIMFEALSIHMGRRLAHEDQEYEDRTSVTYVNLSKCVSSEVKNGKELEACLADFGLAKVLPTPHTQNSAQLWVPFRACLHCTQ